jgi:MFS family permease
MSNKLKDDFTLTTEVDEHGKSRQVSTYIGPIFDLDLDQMGLNRIKMLVVFLYIGGIASHLAAGFLAHSAANLWYVSIPYALAYLPIGLLGFALLRLPREVQNLKRYQTETSFTRGRQFAMIAMGFSTFSALGLAFFMLLTQKAFEAPVDYGYILLELISALMFFNLFTKLNQVRISTRIENKAN